MSVPLTGTVQLTQALTAYGAGLGTGLTQLVRGGKYVPNNGTAYNNNVPTSVTINMLSLRGAHTVPAGLALGLVGAYFGETFQNNIWYDVSGSGNNATTINGTINVNTNGINGHTYISGNTAANITFPSAILPATYTLFHVTRYADTSERDRIFTSKADSGINWLSGFWGNKSGLAYHEGWLTQTGTDWSSVYTSGITDSAGVNWLLSTDQNSRYRANGITQGTSGGSSRASPMTINGGWNGTELSNWECACVLVYNYTLSENQCAQVEEYLNGIYAPTLLLGLTYITYSGNMNDDTNFFSSATKNGGYGYSYNGANLGTLTRNFYQANNGQVNISVQLLGLYFPHFTGNHTFYLNSDDCSYCWVGANAVRGFSTGNYTVAQPGAHGVTSWTASSAQYLTRGQYYPVRIQFGQGGGGYDLQFSFNRPYVGQTSGLLGHFMPGGLLFKFYDGYMADNVNYFSSLTPTNTGFTIDGTSLFTMSAGINAVNQGGQFSSQHFGYFLPQTTGSHTFWLASDDCSYFWIGQYAKYGYSTANATINVGGLHPVIKQSGTVILTAGILYPILIQFGQAGGGANLQFSFQTPTLGETYDLSGYFYNQGI